MKNLGTLIRSLFSMGRLGLVFLLMGIALVVGSLSAVSSLLSFDTAWQRIDALAVLNDTVGPHLRAMELDEQRYWFAIFYETPLAGELDGAADHAAQIDAGLDALIADGHFTADLDYYDEDIEFLADFRARLDEHRQEFRQVAGTYQPGDVEEATADITAVMEDNRDLQAMLDELIVRVDADRLEAAEGLPQDLSRAILGIGLALVAMLLLALWGYRALASLTQPVTDLTNAVIAVGGDQVRPELLDRLLRQGGPAGRLARALAAFAQAIDARDAALKQDIHRLRDQLVESRRRRLKLSGRA